MTPPSLNGWSKLSNAAVERMAEVGPYGFAVYGVLLEHADQHGTAFPSAARIAQLTRMSRRHVFRAINSLEKAGWVRVQRAAENGRPRPNRYLLMPLSDSDSQSPSDAAMVTNSHQDGDSQSLGMVTDSHKNKTHREQDPINKKKARGCAAVVVDVPKELDTEAFTAAWSEWKTYRKQIRHPLKPITEKRQLATLAAWGDAKAILSLQTAIEKGWQGFFEPQGESRNGHNGNGRCAIGPGQRYTPGAAERDSTIGKF